MDGAMHKLLLSNGTKEHFKRVGMEKPHCCTYAKGEPASSLRSQSGRKDGEGWRTAQVWLVGWNEHRKVGEKHTHTQHRKAIHYYRRPILEAEALRGHIILLCFPLLWYLTCPFLRKCLWELPNHHVCSLGFALVNYWFLSATNLHITVHVW